MEDYKLSHDADFFYAIVLQKEVVIMTREGVFGSGRIKRFNEDMVHVDVEHCDVNFPATNYFMRSSCEFYIEP